MKNTKNNTPQTSNLLTLEKSLADLRKGEQPLLEQINAEKAQLTGVLNEKMSTIPGLLGVPTFEEAYGLISTFKKHGTVFPARKGGKKRFSDEKVAGIDASILAKETIKAVKEKHKVSSNYILGRKAALRESGQLKD